MFIDLVICPNKDKQTYGLFVCVYGTYTAPWENVMVSKRKKNQSQLKVFCFKWHECEYYNLLLSNHIFAMSNR